MNICYFCQSTINKTCTRCAELFQHLGVKKIITCPHVLCVHISTINYDINIYNDNLIIYAFIMDSNTSQILINLEIKKFPITIEDILSLFNKYLSIL